MAVQLFADLVRGNLDVIAPDFMLVELVNVLKWRFHRERKETRGTVKRVVESGLRFVLVEKDEVEELEKLMYRYDLTAYDACYLLVIQMEKCKLVTDDPKLLEVKEWCVRLDKLDL